MRNERAGKVRIIAGQWRGKRLEVADKSGLRPTGDRVRETLFNWLAPVLVGARCLDLYAGTGALGLEAASRGAREVTLVERDPDLVTRLTANVRMLDATNTVEVVQAEAMAWLRTARQPYDIVFLDPPFDGTALETALAELARGQWLSARATVYLEMSRHASLPALPVDWAVIREKTTGSVRFCLARRDLCA